MAKKKAKQAQITTEKRAPVVAVMGHIDHGKSSLLDYIRKSNVVEGEAGGITQHVSAYEAEHKDRMITFIDTPGHEAFAATRSRGATIADVAILVVAADDGVKEQTKGALEFIKASGIPFVVAINKIDKPESDVNRTKSTLMENEVYLEGMGGDVSYAEVSAKTGQGIDDLLDTVLLAADLEELEGKHGVPASGVVLESELDPKRGVAATLIIKNGDLQSGNYIVVGDASAPVRILEDFSGAQIKEASFSKPVKVIGFDTLPAAGEPFITLENKKALADYYKDLEKKEAEAVEAVEQVDRISEHTFIPLIIKADVGGSIDAIKHQLQSITHETAEYKVIFEGVGDISDNDIKQAGGSENVLVVGFNVGMSNAAKDLSETYGITAATFSIIYELTEFLEEELEKRRPRLEVKEIHGEAKILRVFSTDNKGAVVGGKVKTGAINKKDTLTIIRRDVAIGTATIRELQQAKQATDEVQEGQEFGVMLSTKLSLTEGDKLQAVKIVQT